MSNMFSNCDSLESINLDNFNTNNVTDMSDMFSEAYTINNIILGEKFNTKNVETMNCMFELCHTLKSLGGQCKFKHY